MTEPRESGADTTKAQVLRFILVGGLNTAVTYSIFILLGLVVEPWLAYTIAFAAGLLWTGIGSSRFVFRVKFSFGKVALFTACYVAVWGVGQLLIGVIAPKGVVDLLITSMVILIATTPLTFLIGRFVFARSNRTSAIPEVTS